MSYPDLDAVFKQYGDWWCKERGGKCDRMNTLQKGYEDRRLVILDPRADYYGDLAEAMKPQIGANQVLTNSTSIEQSQAITLSKATTSSFTWSLQEGFKLGMSIKFSVGIPAIASTTTTMSGELSFSATQSTTKTEQRTWQVSQPIRVPPKSEVEAVLFIDERKFSQKFHSKCTLSGYVCSNSPDRIDGHYFWFHDITNILSKFPQPGFTVKNGVVFYQGDGSFDGLMGVRTRLDITERPLGGGAALKNYSIVDPMIDAAIADAN
jgi:hypothetical protein